MLRLCQFYVNVKLTASGSVPGTFRSIDPVFTFEKRLSFIPRRLVGAKSALLSFSERGTFRSIIAVATMEEKIIFYPVAAAHHSKVRPLPCSSSSHLCPLG